MNEDSRDTALNNVVRIDDERIKEHLGNIVRSSVEETLNGLLDAEADRLCNAGRYERSQARRDFRSGTYSRKLQTQAGEVTLKVPSYGIRPLRRRSSSATVAGKSRWKKPWWRCTWRVCL